MQPAVGDGQQYLVQIAHGQQFGDDVTQDFGFRRGLRGTFAGVVTVGCQRHPGTRVPQLPPHRGRRVDVVVPPHGDVPNADTARRNGRVDRRPGQHGRLFSVVGEDRDVGPQRARGRRGHHPGRTRRVVRNVRRQRVELPGGALDALHCVGL
ncbi:MAG TPA: hypothetical protein VJT49_03650 [Amycolatopsis sp.]|uniref:hypothetical protein n=1 Tax=Amycolatopsis sp. TaxID=37632 RepID=UPI002B49A1E8|nr:hypothetical protein [Amycolatopsis sp.]HKS44204.1 hypothetical protein [Amycolatopsis sp.]